MTTKPLLPDPSLNWDVPLSVVALIAESESCRLTAYRCPAGVLTIGWGETEGGVYEGETITQAQADAMLCLAIKRFATRVRTMCTVETNVNEVGALVSLAYNIGLGEPGSSNGLYASAVLKAHNAGNKAAAAKAFAAINKFRNPKTKRMEVSTGLIHRRALEAALYLTPVAEVAPAAPVAPAAGAAVVAAVVAPAPAPVATPAPLPQAVVAPVSPAKHPLTLAGVGAMAAGPLAALNDLTSQASSVGSTAQTLAANAQATVSSVQTAAGTAHDVLHTVAHFAGLSPSMLVYALLTAGGAGAVAFVYKLHRDGRL